MTLTLALTLPLTMTQVPEAHAAVIAELCGCMPLALRLCGCALGNARVRTTPEQLIATLQLEAGRLQELHALSAMSGDVSVEACIASRPEPSPEPEPEP